MKDKIKIGCLDIIYDNRNIKIVKSYIVQDEYSMEYILKEFLKETKYLPKRNMKSWINEWKVHNLFFNKFHIFESHTVDCDLEQDIKWYKELFYFIVSKFC